MYRPPTPTQQASQLPRKKPAQSSQFTKVPQQPLTSTTEPNPNQIPMPIPEANKLKYKQSLQIMNYNDAQFDHIPYSAYHQGRREGYSQGQGHVQGRLRNDGSRQSKGSKCSKGRARKYEMYQGAGFGGRNGHYRAKSQGLYNMQTLQNAQAPNSDNNSKNLQFVNPYQIPKLQFQPSPSPITSIQTIYPPYVSPQVKQIQQQYYTTKSPSPIIPSPNTNSYAYTTPNKGPATTTNPNASPSPINPKKHHMPPSLPIAIPPLQSRPQTHQSEKWKTHLNPQIHRYYNQIIGNKNNNSHVVIRHTQARRGGGFEEYYVGGSRVLPGGRRGVDGVRNVRLEDNELYRHYKQMKADIQNIQSIKNSNKSGSHASISLKTNSRVSKLSQIEQGTPKRLRKQPNPQINPQYKQKNGIINIYSNTASQQYENTSPTSPTPQPQPQPQTQPQSQTKSQSKSIYNQLSGGKSLGDLHAGGASYGHVIRNSKSADKINGIIGSYQNKINILQYQNQNLKDELFYLRAAVLTKYEALAESSRPSSKIG